MSKHRSETGERVVGRGNPSHHVPRRGLIAAVLLVLVLAGAGASLWARGYRAYVIHTGSMVPTAKPGDLVIDRRPEGRYRVGNVITFRHSDLTTDLVTHRITAIAGSGLISTKGDANRTADAWQIRPNQVRGVEVLRLRDLGYVVVFLRQPAGIASLATATMTIVLLWGLFFAPAEQAPKAQRASHRARPALP